MMKWTKHSSKRDNLPKEAPKIPVATDLPKEAPKILVAVPLAVPVGDETKSKSDVSFYEQLEEMFSGKSIMSEDTMKRLVAADQGNPSHGLVGNNFGSTMDDAIALWGGAPSSIWMRTETCTQLTFHHSHLAFHLNALVLIRLHAVDFPGQELIEGLKFGRPVPDLKKVFPQGKIVEARSGVPCSSIELDRVRISTQAALGNGLISIEVVFLVEEGLPASETHSAKHHEQLMLALKRI